MEFKLMMLQFNKPNNQDNRIVETTKGNSEKYNK